jgi:hypothetical protein
VRAGRQGLAQRQIASQLHTGLQQPRQDQRERDPRQRRHRGRQRHARGHAQQQNQALHAYRARPAFACAVEGCADGRCDREPGEQQPRPAHTDGPLPQKRGQGEFSESEQGRRGGTGEVDGPGAGECPHLRGTLAVATVRFPPCGQRPHPGRRRDHERGRQHQRCRRGDAEREHDGEGGRGSPHTVGKDGLRAQRLNDERVRELRGQQRAQAAGRSGGCGSRQDGEGHEHRQIRAGEQAEPGERASTEGQPGRQLGAGPLRIQPWPEHRGPCYLADHVRGREPGAQRIPAGALAGEEDERERRHRDRKPRPHRYKCPLQQRSGSELAVTHGRRNSWRTDGVTESPRLMRQPARTGSASRRVIGRVSA